LINVEQRRVSKKYNKFKFLNKKFFIPSKKVSSNSHNTIAINELGDLYGWGSGDNSRIGLKIDLRDYITEPLKFNYFSQRQLKVFDISMGDSHILSCAKSKDGTNKEMGVVYSWGLDLYGRLGYLNDIERNDDEERHDQEIYVFRRTPFPIKIKESVSRVYCGFDYSACVTETGKLYTWGNNSYGNLGVVTGNAIEQDLDEYNERYVVNTPMLVKDLAQYKIIQVACGHMHMLALTSERKIFSWGTGKYGQLGLGVKDVSYTPTTIKYLENEDVIFIAAGENNSAAINSKGQLYMWGSGEYGKLGIGSNDSVDIPKKLDDILLSNVRIYYVSLGPCHTLCCSCKYYY
jgi:alpha-tubulin suppressor-like RCC1 family protein